MNPEIHKLVEELKELRHSPKYSKDIGDPPTHLAYTMSSLLALVAEQQENAARIMERQTNKLIVLTWALLILTAGLFAFTVMLYEDAHAQTHHSNLAQHHPEK